MQFKVDTFYNPYLSAGVSRVDGILTVTAEGGGETTRSLAVVGLVIDTSGSMDGDRIRSVKNATRKVIDLLDENTAFFVVRFSDRAETVYPLAPATAAHRTAAAEQVQKLEAGGGTRISTGLTLARNEFLKMPNAIHYALFLTDGKNDEHDEAPLNTALQQAEGVFQCDCRGVGTDWQ